MRLVSVIIIGKGNVGRAFIRQLTETRETFLRRGIDLRVIGVVGKTSALYVSQGVTAHDLNGIAEGRAQLGARAAGRGGGWDDVTDAIASMDAEELVVIDLTAEPDGEAHAHWLRLGWHVITANKKPLTAPLIHYDAIMAAHQRQDGPSYRYGATVGAGLPVIAALQEIMATGDGIIEIRAAVSGTLGFIFSACEEGTPFATAVTEAKERGYTEPDPRDDLSGHDVATKALIMARLLGRRLDFDGMSVESLVPRGLGGGSVDDFMAGLAAESRAIDDRFRAIGRRGNTLRYLLSITPQGAKVGLEEVPRGKDFGGLKGPESMFIIRSRRYDALPLVIRGPGAGAEVTAAGVFSDLLRVVARSKPLPANL